MTEDAHPLDGIVETRLGPWMIRVLSDDVDGPVRRFELTLQSLRGEAACPFVIRVPGSVIELERPDTWPADLRRDIAYWIGVGIIERGQIIWWPVKTG